MSPAIDFSQAGKVLKMPAPVGLEDDIVSSLGRTIKHYLHDQIDVS